MPLFFRAMFLDGESPLVGREANRLGVRLPPHPRPDLPVDSTGMVVPNSGGMSVSPSVDRLPPHTIPTRLRHLFPKARGNDGMVCWRMGEGAFVDGAVSDRLYFRANSRRHGQVEPAASMPAEEYQAALAATRDQWVREPWSEEES